VRSAVKNLFTQSINREYSVAEVGTRVKAAAS